MGKQRVFGLALVASWAFFAVVVVSCTVSANRRQPVTLGMLASNRNPGIHGRVIVSNCVGGVTSGRYLVFLSPDPNRHHVVLSFAVEPASGSVFTGYCVGVVDEPVGDCPTPPPLCLVIDCRPAPPPE